LDNLVFALNGILPIFAIVFFGFFLRRKNIINEEFCAASSNLVFIAALPAMLFRDVATTDIRSVFNINTILFAGVSSVVIMVLLQVISGVFIKEKQKRGAFIQGIIRSNYAIFGLPIAYNLFGQEGLTKSAILLAFVTPLINILSIITLTINSPNHIKTNIFKLIGSIIKNPFIIAIAAAIPFSFFGIIIPEIAIKTINYVSSLAMPLALIGIGGSFSFNSMKKSITLSMIAASLRNIIIPIIITITLIYFGFRGVDAGVVFILYAAPTAISSYIMAKAMGSDSELASNIILISTLSSILTITLGIFFLKSYGIV